VTPASLARLEAGGSRGEGLEPGPMLRRRPRSERWTARDLRFSFADRGDRVARLRAAVGVWLRAPRLWWGLLVAGLVVGVFGWAVTVLGIALATAQEGADQWWMVLVFGAVTLALVLGVGYLLATRLLGRAAGPPVGEPGRRPGAVGTAESAAAATAAPTPPGAPLPATGEPLEPLSERELEVLQLVATGRSNREIATELYVATGTVKAHLNNIFRKLEARSRLEAVTRARDLRLLAEHDGK
jgi:DNA-binding CsgD family transcriptional regulator